MASDLVAHAHDRAVGGGLRRHACRQFRSLCLGRAQPGLRHQRFRRGPSRAVGMGPQAPGGQCRGRRALHGRRQGARPKRRRAACVRELSQAHAALCRDGLSRGLVRRASTSARCSTRCRRSVRRNAERAIAKARAKGHIRSLDKLTEKVDGEQRIVEDVPLIVRETHTESGTAGPRGARTRCCVPIIASLTLDRRAPAGALPDRRRGAQGGGRGQRRHELLGDPAAGRRRATIRCSCRSSRRSLGAGALRLDVPWVHQRGPARGGRASALTQGSPDIFLGWGEVEGRHFYVRQLADMKGSAKFGEQATAGIARLRRILRPVRLGAGAGACQVAAIRR